jgi:hypothetical protein
LKARRSRFWNIHHLLLLLLCNTVNGRIRFNREMSIGERPAMSKLSRATLNFSYEETVLDFDVDFRHE